MRICVVGTGYVGLVVGACLAGSGNHVICTDTSAAKIALLNGGEVPIYEPGLKDVVERNVATERLSFSTDVAEGIRASTLIFVAVGTPPGDDGSADLKYVRAVAAIIGQTLNSYKVVICKSTVPVGTCDIVHEIVASKLAERGLTSAGFSVVSNPEFLKEGHALEDFRRPDRIVVGTEDPTARDLMTELYAPFNRTNNRMLFMDVKSAEMTKYASNAMLATRISFMNEIAGLCEAVGANVDQVRRGVGSDPRIGNKFLFPGVGFGGSCLPKDVRALMGTAGKHGRRMRVLESVFEVNDLQKQVLVDRFVAHYRGEVKGKTVAVWGLAFKPRTDDLREAPALQIIAALLELGVEVRATDPVALDNARTHFGDNVSLVKNEYEALEGADALMVVTEWNAYRTPDFEKMASLMNEKVVLDGRNLYSRKRMQARGFAYYSIGRPAVAAE